MSFSGASVTKPDRRRTDCGCRRGAGGRDGSGRARDWPPSDRQGSISTIENRDDGKDRDGCDRRPPRQIHGGHSLRRSHNAGLDSDFYFIFLSFFGVAVRLIAMRLVGFRSGPGLLPLGRPFRRISTPGPALFSTHSRLSALPPPSSQNENQAQQQQSHPSKNNETSKSSTEAGTNQWFQQEDGAPKRPSFNSLLLQSTSMRVYKDRAEQKRFAEMRDADAARRSGIQSPYRSGILISVCEWVFILVC